MARREHSTVTPCAEPGCPERTHGLFGTLRDRDAHMRRQNEHPWRCTRHRRPEEVLSPAGPGRVSILLVDDDRGRHSFRRPDGTWWPLPYVDGPGYLVFAADFPIGTAVRFVAIAEPPPVDTNPYAALNALRELALSTCAGEATQDGNDDGR